MINGTIEHLVLGYIVTLLSIWIFKSPFPALPVFLAIELTQYDIFRTLRFTDTIHDLTLDVAGSGVALLTVKIFF